MWTGELPGVVVKLGNLLQGKIRRCGMHKKVKEGTYADGLRCIQTPGKQKIIHRADRSTRSSDRSEMQCAIHRRIHGIIKPVRCVRP
jgi:hypothetical protein